MRRGIIGAILVLLGLLACGNASRLALKADVSRFVVSGASHVEVHRTSWSTRVVGYDYAQAGLGWDTLLDRQLRAARWLPPDFSGAPGQFTIYTYVNMYWFGAIWEEANVQGDPRHARIILRRWVRLRWLPGYSIDV